MRKIILLGAVAALTLGSASAYAMGSGNVAPEASPYALIAPQTLAPALGEGRSAYTSPNGYFGEQPGNSAPAVEQSPTTHRHYRRY
jgi:hypothetical protein